GQRPSASGRTWRMPDGSVHLALETTYRVQHMERLDLGTSYVLVAARIAALVGSLWEWERGLRESGKLEPTEPQTSWDIWADATGVGRPVMDMLREALEADPKTRRALLHPVVFTHGDRFTRGGFEKAGDVLGKAYLVSRLQVLFQQDLLWIPARHPEAA